MANRSSMNTKYYARGDLIPGIFVDGMDVLSVKNAMKFAIEHATTCGPVILECHTYRYSGHSMSDPGTSYRSREEIDKVRKERDPILSFVEKMISHNILDEKEVKVSFTCYIPLGIIIIDKQNYLLGYGKCN